MRIWGADRQAQGASQTGKKETNSCALPSPFSHRDKTSEEKDCSCRSSGGSELEEGERERQIDSDITMGNAAMVCGGRLGGEPRSPVTVLQADGNVLSLYSSRVRVVDLILDYPNHFVCHSSSLVLLHHSKILPLHTLLVPGEVYFLLPMPHRPDPRSDPDNESDTSSLLHIEPPRRAVHRTGSTKFVISTEQFSKIMAGTSVKQGRPGSGGVSASTVKRKRQARGAKGMQKTTSSSSSSNAAMAPWRPALSRIEEVAAN